MKRAGNSNMAETIGMLDWQHIAGELNAGGYAVIPRLLAPMDCRKLASLYANDNLFRSRIIMQQHGFGRGEYKYFRYPLPNMVGELRAALYPHLASIANCWHEQMRLLTRFPASHNEFVARCHSSGQKRPTPLLVQYVTDDHNCLHQDIYGDHVFPIQVAVLLAEPGRDFTGGEFVLTEQRPRMQSRAEVVPLTQGDAVVFTVQHRPVNGSRGSYRVNIRHGVSRVRSGLRHTLGIIFHDAA